MNFENKPIYKNILLLLDVVFVANGEIIKLSGEDSFGYSFNENGGVIAVFDGCGVLDHVNMKNMELKQEHTLLEEWKVKSCADCLPIFRIKKRGSITIQTTK